MYRIEARPVKPDSVSLTLSVSEVAKLLGVSRDLVYELVAQGELPALRLGRRIVLPRRALEELLEGAGADAKESSEGTGPLEIITTPPPLNPQYRRRAN